MTKQINVVAYWELKREIGGGVPTIGRVWQLLQVYMTLIQDVSKRST